MEIQTRDCEELRVKEWAIVPPLRGSRLLFGMFPTTSVVGYDFSSLRDFKTILENARRRLQNVDGL